MKRRDYTGSRFGKLTVTEMHYGIQHGSKKRTECTCVCDCGSKTRTVIDNIISGKKVSCGCDTSFRRSMSMRKDLTGMRFGRLRVESMDYSRRKSIAVCRCDCGSTVSVNSALLSYGRTQSCGCLQSERASESNTKDWSGISSPYGITMLRRNSMDKYGKWLWDCECGICGNIFIAAPSRIMNGHITSCGCRKRSSREELIRNELMKLGSAFVEQYTFPDCKDIQPLMFDFAIFKDDCLYCLIEYDGKQHFCPVSLFGGESAYNTTSSHDRIKNEYCEREMIPLFRIPYTCSDKDVQQIIRDIIIRRDCNTSISNNWSSAMLPVYGMKIQSELTQ